ncbi:hypothetical protein L0D00_25525, partial [Salmonella enterica subsp. enterica]|uniref:hypothetical protein n=1 Tax=Salmonella enterica TaxID=28901 RepID=UPI001EE8882F
ASIDTADVNHFTQTAGRLKRKILKFRVDSERGKRNIRHLATVGGKPRRICSLTIYQTICVGTRRYGFLTSQDEK